MTVISWLFQGKKARLEKVFIALNNVLNLSRQSSSYLQQKVKSVSLQVQTAHSVIGVNAKQAETSFGNKEAQKLNHIENNPLAVIVTLIIIYKHVIPSIIYVGPITP